MGLEFLHADSAIYFIAQNQGFQGNMITGDGTPFGNPAVYEYSYLDGQVVHIRGEAEHSVNDVQLEYIRNFILE